MRDRCVVNASGLARRIESVTFRLEYALTTRCLLSAPELTSSRVTNAGDLRRTRHVALSPPDRGLYDTIAAERCPHLAQNSPRLVAQASRSWSHAGAPLQ